MLIQASIEAKLKLEFNPLHLEVINESANHNVPVNSETHFKVLLVSELFDSLSKIKRQQWVYKTLSAELQGEVHALSMQTFTPDEWQQSPEIAVSPDCLGGSKADS